MASLNQWDTTWQERFKKTYATNLTTLSLYPEDPIRWMTFKDVPYGQNQVQRTIRRPDQDVQVSKNEQYGKTKYAESLTITLDMPNLSDELAVKEEYYAGDTPNALGHVADLNENFKDGIINFILNGTDTDPFARGILEADANGTGSTVINDPGHADVASAISSVGKWDVYEDMQGDLAQMETSLEDKGFNGKKGILAPPVARPFIERYVVDHTATPYKELLGFPVFYSPHVDQGATLNAASIYMVDMEKFEAHMTPMKARMFWSDEQETYVWRWKVRCVPVSIPKWDGTDWLKGIVGFDVDFTT